MRRGNDHCIATSRRNLLFFGYMARAAALEQSSLGECSPNIDGTGNNIYVTCVENGIIKIAKFEGLIQDNDIVNDLSTFLAKNMSKIVFIDISVPKVDAKYWTFFDLRIFMIGKYTDSRGNECPIDLCRLALAVPDGKPTEIDNIYYVTGFFMVEATHMSDVIIIKKIDTEKILTSGKFVVP